MASSADSTAASPPAALPLPTSTSESARGASAHATQPDPAAAKPAAGSPPTPALTLAASAATVDSTTARTDAHRLARATPGLGLTPNAGVSTSAGAAPAGGTSAAESLAPPACASAPAMPGAQSAAASSYGVDLQQTIDAVHATLELATRQGLSSARIALAPAELGEIRIHLTQSASGLVARLTANTPAAAQALGEGRSELRESLQSLGLTALHLDSGAFRVGRAGPRGPCPAAHSRACGEPSKERPRR